MLICESLGTGTFEDVLAQLASLDDAALARSVEWRGYRRSAQELLYDMLRDEQHAGVRAQLYWRPTEAERIVVLAGQAFGDLRGLLLGRRDELLDAPGGDPEWTVRQILRHALAAELRYAAQILYSAHRAESDPVAIPPERLPCDRLSPPEPTYADTRTAGFGRILERLASARAQTDALVSGLRDEALGRPSQWGSREVDVRYRIHQLAAHLTEHVIQCEKALAALREHDGEARRIARRLSATRGAHESVSDDAALRALDSAHLERSRSIASAA